MISGRHEFRDHVVDGGQIIGMMVVEKPMTSVGIDLYVALNACCSEDTFEYCRHLAHAWLPILGAIAGDNRTRAWQRSL
jgi:hypothetical protein